VRVLVIGAGGFLGSHVVRRAREDAMAVVTAGRSVLAGSAHHEVIDLARDSPEHLGAVLARIAPEVVVNCAGATSGTAEELSEANISAVFSLLEATMLAGWRGRLIHLGSAAEYGRSPEGSSVSEAALSQPVGVYGATKLGGTRLVELARLGGADAVVLRIFNPLGMGAPEAGLPGRLVSEVRRAVADGGDIRLGPLDAVRDFIDARDVADAVIAAATASELPSPVLNVGTGLGVPVRALVDGLLAISRCRSRVSEEAPGSERSAGVTWQQADIALAARDLGWKPVHDLDSTLRDWWGELF